MEMSKGVSLLRTAQSLLTGRTIAQGTTYCVLEVNFKTFLKMKYVCWDVTIHENVQTVICNQLTVMCTFHGQYPVPEGMCGKQIEHTDGLT